MSVVSRRLLVLALFVFPASVSAARPGLAADVAAEEAAIRKIGKQWVDVVATNSPAAAASFYAPDGMIMPPGAAPAKGPKAIAEVWNGLFKLKGFHLTFAPTDIQVARSGDIAYEVGTYVLSFEGKKGPLQEHGKYVVVWKKLDKSWKAAADIFNSNGPPQPAPPKKQAAPRKP